MDIRSYNRKAWDKYVDSGESEWTKPVSAEIIAHARKGDFAILLTETKPVPREWFPVLKGADILCLASGGGQQGPVLAAAGAKVTVFDNSPRQLDQDRFVAEREGLDIKLVEGDMRDLSVFSDASFDLVFHPVSNLFIHEIRPVWREAYRVLRPGGTLLAGFMNPIFYAFDIEKAEKRELVVQYKLPYADSEYPEIAEKMIANGDALEHSHSLTDQLGGQTDAGFAIIGFYEDHMRNMIISEYTPTYIATRAIKN
ncbi:MAG: class I SAM-dependent methyltransferase [Anaerolineae bacterium]|jgi:ubiquinone/menaquinone biosynthesis C-methylase UbiE|nr:class I SAM-dependent methyltransferase [Anaerolineae bacterium]MBT7069692.1 class I SAM-dependent methyltransferase [Anaerolineae bacterium]MBT7323632.1 class I SAM-dependent methyltransferase [Anaerolineae bacterium]